MGPISELGLWQRSEQRRACFGMLQFVGWIMSTSGVVRRTPRLVEIFGPTNSNPNQKGVNYINP